MNAMQTVDLVIAGLGVAAIAATVLGLVFYDDLGGETDLTFVSEAQALETQTQAIQGATMFAFATPTNATGADLTIDVSMSGVSLTGGSATVSVELRGPNNETAASEVFSLSLSPGSQSHTGSFDLSGTWATVPEDTHGNPNTFDASMVYDSDFTVIVTVTPPGGPGAGVGGFQTSAAVGGDVLVYHHMARLPEATTA